MAYNKKIKYARCAGWDANTQGGFAIMPYVPAPVIGKLVAYREFLLLV